MPILPGAPAIMRLNLIATDTFEALANQNVELRLFDPAVGTYRPIAKGVTDSTGGMSVALALPTTPGKYRYVAYFPGSPELQADTSPETVVEIALPKK